MSYKRKEQKIKKIAKIYLYSIVSKNAYLCSPVSNRIDSFRSAVELAYSSLDAPLQKIINNDFFYQDYPGWWRFLYKKINYYRLKVLAVNSFLEAFYAI